MLVLSRKKGEQVLIGDQIEVTIAEIRGNSVRLAFAAPHEIPIHRKEIRHRIQSEKARDRGPADLREIPM